jgi:hypothetical protein
LLWPVVATILGKCKCAFKQGTQVERDGSIQLTSFWLPCFAKE